MKGDTSLFNKFLGWCFSDSGRIKQFKQKLILARRNVEAIINAALSKENCGWEQCRKEFIKWGGFEENEFKSCFKGEKSGSVKELYTGLLFEREVGLVDEFLSWCFDSEKDKIDGFKKAFVSGDKAVNFCIDKIKAEKLRTVKNFLKWVEMSKEEYKKLQQECSNKLEDKQKSILEEAFVDLLGKRKRESDESTQKPKSSIQKIKVEGVQSAKEETIYK